MSNWIVIMAGGGGTRLWPLSRRRQPKQFLPLLPGDETLLGATVRRSLPLGDIAHTLVVTAASQVADVRRCVPDLPEANIVVEPTGRNTAACIGLAAVEVRRRDPAGVMAVLPSDQYVTDEAAFRAAALAALELAAAGEVVALGLHPTRPETGYGYIECGPPGGAARKVVRFVEKPDRTTAESYVKSGTYLWNAGMFFFPAARILADLQRFLPELATLLDRIAADPSRTSELYPSAPKISIDYAVMEKLPGAMWVIPAQLGWSDVGSWAALPEVRPPDPSGNTVLGEALPIDSHGNVLISDGKTLIAAVGVQDLVIVATGDAVLVLPKSRAQEVKSVVEALEATRREPYL
jgi:mannose-1-phosphate guanylyltransferase